MLVRRNDDGTQDAGPEKAFDASAERLRSFLSEREKAIKRGGLICFRLQESKECTIAGESGQDFGPPPDFIRLLDGVPGLRAHPLCLTLRNHGALCCPLPCRIESEAKCSERPPDGACGYRKARFEAGGDSSGENTKRTRGFIIQVLAGNLGDGA
jgi:hypothetical protein